MQAANSGADPDPGGRASRRHVSEGRGEALRVRPPVRELCNVGFYYCRVRVIAHGRLISPPHPHPTPLQPAHTHKYARTNTHTHTPRVPFGLPLSLSRSRCDPCHKTTALSCSETKQIRCPIRPGCVLSAGCRGRRQQDSPVRSCGRCIMMCI